MKKNLDGTPRDWKPKATMALGFLLISAFAVSDSYDLGLPVATLIVGALAFVGGGIWHFRKG